MRNVNLSLLDSYISKQILETFLMGVVVFTSLAFASDQFLYLVKQISAYGIPFKVALLAVLLQLPYMIVFTIPMAVLLATILTFNKLNNNLEITVMRSCGISLTRLAMPVLILGILATLGSFIINEFIVPAANTQARNIMLWAITQKNLPKEKYNFSFKEFDVNKQLKRLFYVSQYKNNTLEGVTFLDLSKQGTIQVLQAKSAKATPENWIFYDAVNHIISPNGKIMNTAIFDEYTLSTTFNLKKLNKLNKASELNFFDLSSYINKLKKEGKQNLSILKIRLHEKLALPLTCFTVALIAVPLAISPPRARFNRGLLFSIIIIFCYYLLRAVATSLGEAQAVTPFLSAWLPNMIILSLGTFLFYKKAYQI